MSKDRKVISIHKKRGGAFGPGGVGSYTAPAKGKVRAQVVENGKTMHIDIER